MLSEWAWIIVVFLFGTAMFAVGNYTGRLDSDKCPSENAWINVRKYSIDAQKEVEQQRLHDEHEQQIKMIERGCYDNLVIADEEVENDED